MKTILIMTAFMLSCAGSFITLQPTEGTFQYEDLIAADTDPFSILLEWVSEYYVSAKHTIDVQDRQAGLIIVKAVFTTIGDFGNVYYNYMLKMLCIDIKMLSEIFYNASFKHYV